MKSVAKRLFIVAVACLFVLGMVTGCADKSGEDNTSKAVQVYAPDGAPAIGFAKMIDEKFDGAEFHVVQPTQIGGMVLNGTADIAIMPTNAAALLYSKGADIAMLGVTNFGSLYLVGKDDSEKSLEDLKGEVVYSIGQGNVPDLVFRSLLKSANITYRFSDKAEAGVVSLAYVSEGTEIIGGLSAGTMKYGVISEPAATVACNKVQGASVLLDIQKEYEKATGVKGGFPQAALVVKKSFLQARRNYLTGFVATFSVGVTWAEKDPAAALTAIKSAGSTTVSMLTADIAKRCNLGFTVAADAKEQLLSFYRALDGVKEQGETPVGATLPDDSFFLEDLMEE